MGLFDTLFGKPLASTEGEGQKIAPSTGVPIFGLDALSSAAYGPEAALTILLPLGLAGVQYILPLTATILVLLIIVFFSYLQTMAAYPQGGGSYTVAKENLGPAAGLMAAAALMIDYLLNVAVGISAGIGALVSALPSLQPHTLAMCLGVLALLTLVNLRGMREAGAAFLIPTYFFVGTLAIIIVIGLYKALSAGGHPDAIVAPHLPSQATATMGLWLLLKAFASGCTALTGVEAVSNGVQAFRAPVVPNARKTLTIIIVMLAGLLAGVAAIVHFYGISATDPGSKDYQSVLSMAAAAVVGRGWFYGVTMLSVLLVLCLSANTSFAGFPRLCRTVAIDDYLPHSFTARGRRLVFSQGIWVLSILAAVLIIYFDGVTDRLIPLFAVGAFLAFTLSQAGMVRHWRRVGGAAAIRNSLINGLGALATGVTLIVVLVAKFAEGAWVVVLLLPAAFVFMSRIRHHYKKVAEEVKPQSPMSLVAERPPIVVVPVERWTVVTQKALRFALTLSPDVHAVHVVTDAEAAPESCDGTPPPTLAQQWNTVVEAPACAAGVPCPTLVNLPSPYRMVLQPLVKYILQLEKDNPDRSISVVIPVMVEKHWFHYFLHNQRGEFLSAMLLLSGDQRINIINVPWYLES
jgi:amino acid transporter